MPSDAVKPWWEQFFDEGFSQFLLDRENDPSLSPTADFLIQAMGLQSGDTLFDQCCGTGAISIALAKKNINVIGIDQAPHYIERAQKISSEQNLTQAFFEAADAFDYVTPEKCDAVINWYSSFGYTTDDNKNIEMMQRVFESLKPGGHFAMDYMNVPNLLKNFSPVYIRENEIDGQKTSVEKHTTIDKDRGMVGSRWVYNMPDGTTREGQGESRLYYPDDIVDLMKKTGFVDISLHGGFNGEPCDADHQRCIALARAPS